MKTKYTREQVMWAWRFREGLTPQEMLFYWKHYTKGPGQGAFRQVGPDTSFADYLVESAAQIEFDRAHDL
jgi:hypothetical protein